MENEDRILKFKRGMEQLASTPIRSEDYVSPLNEALLKVKGAIPSPDTAKTVIKGVTDHINTNEVQKVLSGNQFQQKLASILESRAAQKAGKMMGQAGGMLSNVGKHIPILGGLAVGLGTALATGDASAGEQAATPILNEADPLGPTEGTLEHKLESGSPMSREEMEILRNRKL
jgi:hypothetical protein